MRHVRDTRGLTARTEGLLRASLVLPLARRLDVAVVGAVVLGALAALCGSEAVVAGRSFLGSSVLIEGYARGSTLDARRI